MVTEQLLIGIAGCLVLVDIVILSVMKPQEKKKSRYGLYAETLAFSLVAFLYSLLTWGFLSDEFSIIEVYSHSSSNLSTSAKLFATWAGSGGSILLLVVLIGAFSFLYQLRAYRLRSNFKVTTSIILNTVFFFFLIIALMKNPFERFSIIPVDGQGLHPSLQTFWMIIHPPIIFLGYVFIILTSALILAQMKTQREEEKALITIFLRMAWLLLTIGIALGGVWAYEVLGWGGYWSWDPVETGSLLPWLALTAYFHLASLTRSGRSLAREFTIIVAFLSLIFLSALTRGGLLQSVHVYALSPAGPFLLFFACGIGIYFLYLKRRTRESLFSLDIKGHSLYSLSLLGSYLSLSAIFLVCFLGITVPIAQRLTMENPPIPDVNFYNNWNFPFVMAFVTCLIGCSIGRVMNLKRFATLILGTILLGIVITVLQWPTANTLANLGFPFLFLGLITITYRLISIVRKKLPLQLLGRSTLHLGIIVLLIGVFVSSSTQQNFTLLDAPPNTIRAVSELTIHLENATVYTGVGRVQLSDRLYPEYSALKLDATIEQEGTSYDCTLWVHLYAAYGVVSTPTIIRTLTQDIYIHIMYNESLSSSLIDALFNRKEPPNSFNISVTTMPLICLVWIGVALLSIGMVIPSISGIRKLSNNQRKHAI